MINVGEKNDEKNFIWFSKGENSKKKMSKLEKRKIKKEGVRWVLSPFSTHVLYC